MPGQPEVTADAQSQQGNAMTGSHPRSKPATIRCTHCDGTPQEVSGRNFLQCQYCQSLAFPSGNPLDVDRSAATDGQLGSTCPCCHDSLQTGEVDRHRALYCERCYGVLLSSESFGRVVSQRRAARMGVESVPSRPIDPVEYDRRLNCPGCHHMMDVHPYYGPGTVVIDSCGECCCVWLDHGELTRIEQAPGKRHVPAVPVDVRTSQSVSPS